MKITAVLTTFWQERLSNVPKILDNLKKSSRAPDEIILLNNNNSYTIGRTDIKVVNSMYNWGAEGRYAAALFEPSDYYLLLDDDLTVKRDTIANFEKQAKNYTDTALGLLGRKIDDGKEYASGKIIEGIELEEVTPVDVLIRMYFVPKDIAAEAAKRMTHDYQGLDDLVLAEVADCAVIPAKNKEYFENLDSQEVGYEKRPDHYKRRNKFFADKLSK